MPGPLRFSRENNFGQVKQTFGTLRVGGNSDGPSYGPCLMNQKGEVAQFRGRCDTYI